MAVTFNSATATISNVITDMVNAINGVGFGCTAQVQPDGTIALFGTGVTLDTGTTSFSDYSNQFPNQPPSVKLDLTALALPDGTIALQGPGSSPQGPSVTLTLPSGSSFAAENNLENLDGATFQLTDADNNTTTFEFVNVANPGRVATTGDVGVYFQWTSSASTNDTIDTLYTKIVDAINGYPVIGDIDGSHVNSIAALTGETFQITDGVDNKVTFEFIDSAGTTTLTKGDMAVSFNSTTATHGHDPRRHGTAINGQTGLPGPGPARRHYRAVWARTWSRLRARRLLRLWPPIPPRRIIRPRPWRTARLRCTVPASSSTPARPRSVRKGRGCIIPMVRITLPKGTWRTCDGTTFQITDGAGKTLTFEFVDTKLRTQAATGNVAVFFNPTEGISTLLTAMATCDQRLHVAGDRRRRHPRHRRQPRAEYRRAERQDLPDHRRGGHYPHLRVRRYQRARLRWPRGDVAVDFNSTASGINMATIRTAMVTAINGADFSCTAQAMPDGSIALYGSNLQLNLTTTPSVEERAVQPERHDLPDHRFLKQDGHLRVHRSVADAADDADRRRRPGRLPFDDGSADEVRAAIVAAINAANTAGNLGCTATVMPDGTIALYGSRLTVNTGTASVFLLTPTTIAFGCTAQVRPSAGMGLDSAPDDTIAIYGMKAVLNTGTTSFVQVGRTSGSYQLQIRLQETEEIPGSLIQYADISYATNGIDIKGKPSQSPLLTDTAITETAAQAPTQEASNFTTVEANAQDLGNLLASNQSTITVSGHLYGSTDVNWYKFQLDYQDIELKGETESSFPTIFDIDYADGLARPDTVIWVFDDTER